MTCHAKYLARAQIWVLHMSRYLQNTKKLSVHISPFPTIHHLNVIIRKDKTKNNLIRYFHACCFSPPNGTFLTAVKTVLLSNGPAARNHLLKKYLEPIIATAKGHLDQERKIFNQKN